MKKSRAAVLLLALAAFAPPGVRAAEQQFTITVTNELPDAPRPSETIVVPFAEVSSRLPNALIDHLAVKFNGQLIPAQVTNFDPDNKKGHADELIFQHDFAAGEKSAKFTVETTADPVAPFPTKTFARYVPERLDDFAWENDRVGHRIYGPAIALPSAGKEQLTTSGIDVWCKRVRYMIVDRWYLKSHDNYHKDTGEGMDMYDVAKSRGAGGLGVWDGKTLHVSGNWKTWKILANGPVRTIFETTYDSWDAGGFQIKETKRFTVDAGHNLDQMDSTFEFQNAAPAANGEVTIGIGLAKHPKKASAAEAAKDGAKRQWLSLWETYPSDGQLGTGIVLAEANAATDFVEDDLNHLILTKAKSGQPLRYYIGAGWERSEDFADQKAWTGYLNDFAKRLTSPLKLEYSAAAPTTTMQSAAPIPAAKLTTGNAPKFNGASPLEWSARMADSELAREGDRLSYHGDPKTRNPWNYTTGLFANDLMALADATGEKRYLDYAEKTVGSFIGPDGQIATYKIELYSLDNVPQALSALLLFQRTGADRYKKAIQTVRAQLADQPRTHSGGFWHKLRYPHQMWLDGLYMGEPFYAAYAAEFKQPAAFDDIAHQLLQMAEHSYDPNAGLFYHVWDESKTAPWANKETGASPSFWGRALGWYAMAYPDVLASFPKDHPKRPELVAWFQKLADGLVKWQDKSGLWWQVLDQGAREGNYLEASASSMFVYALAKGINDGYLDREKYLPAARAGYEGLIRDLIKTDDKGTVNLTQVCKVAGLDVPPPGQRGRRNNAGGGGRPTNAEPDGSNPGGAAARNNDNASAEDRPTGAGPEGMGPRRRIPRNGTFEYYTKGEPIVSNDLKGVGPFITAGIEMEKLLGAK